MNRTLKAILAVVFIGIITFSAISICRTLSVKVDLTERKLYTLSNGSKAIIDKLNQPVTIKLYYAKTAALKAPDAIRQYNNYYFFIKALLEEYAAYGRGKVDLQVIDPRPFSDEEQEALRYGLKRFQITEDESFFFGLVTKTEYGVTKSIDFFTPDRQNFVEYDISYLIDTMTTREKLKIGVLSSLPVMGDDVSGYMAEMMRMQGQQPTPPWAIVQQLRQRYEVTAVDLDIEEIKDVDLLLVIHPKDLSEKTLFAIDQFVLKGGRTIVCVDPYCLADRPNQQAMMSGQMPSSSSDLNRLLKNWGVEMMDETFAGDENLMMTVALRQNDRPQAIIGLMELVPPDCFNADNVISADLNFVRMMFSGVLNEVNRKENDEDKNANAVSRITPLLQTTQAGNSWKVDSPYELMMPNGPRLMSHFTPGKKPITMASLVTGRFKSAFPNGIDIEVKNDAAENDDKESEKEKQPETKHLTGLTEAAESTDCAVAVFTDVDFITDMVAYQRSFFGVSVVGDNSALLLNTVENLSGSGDLIAIRSRGNFYRPFTVVEEIEKEAKAETAEEVDKVNAQIEAFQKELRELVSQARQKGETLIDASELNQSKAQVERKIREAEKRKRELQNQKRETIEAMRNKLRNFCMLLVPVVILVAAILLSIRRRVLRRRYISHASDA